MDSCTIMKRIWLKDKKWPRSKLSPIPILHETIKILRSMFSFKSLTSCYNTIVTLCCWWDTVKRNLSSYPSRSHHKFNLETLFVVSNAFLIFEVHTWQFENIFINSIRNNLEKDDCVFRKNRKYWGLYVMRKPPTVA